MVVRTSVARKLRAAGTSSVNSSSASWSWHTHRSITGNVGHEPMVALPRISSNEKVMNNGESCIMRARTTPANDNNSVPSVVLVTPPPTPPLLLEGDEMFISRAGKSHTVYQLKETSNNDQGITHSYTCDLLLEESYDIEKARKKLSLFGPSSLLDGLDFDTNMRDTKCSGQLSDIFSFDLQEINQGVQNGSGTGSMSWDSSIVMGLYFASNPDELRGSVLELGSGVGLGGILSKVATNIVHDDSQAKTQRKVTLTDVNEDVLDTLQLNMDAASKTSNWVFKDGVIIQKLDWYDFIGDSQTDTDNTVDRYDTIIASDCAYLHSQVIPLSETITKLLGNTRGGEKLHMFAPYNRGVVHELIQELHKKDMHVDVEDVELSKYRIKKGVDSRLAVNGQLFNDGISKSSQDMTCGVSKFLHITAWHKTQLEIASEADGTKDLMTDID